MSEPKPYFAVLTLIFASVGDLRIWRDKIETFSTPKAVEYLRANGQKSLKIFETNENGVIKAVCIWEYESEKSRDVCQAYWGKWLKFEDNYSAKTTWLRGTETFSW